MMTVLEQPKALSKFELICLGTTGWVYQINEEIALKYVRQDQEEEHAHENAIYDAFEARELPSEILQSFFRRPGLNFLAFMAGGSMGSRIRSNQIRDHDRRGKLLEVQEIEPLDKIEQWAFELASATSFLESLNMAHGDLRPENILLDQADHLKLADFDCACEFGSPSWGGGPPWARLQGPEAGKENGTWGDYGPRTEQFAFGSVLYTLVRGFEPYEYEEPGPAIVQKLQDMLFPELTGDRIDRIIDKCWRGQYASMQELAVETAQLDGASGSGGTVLDYQAVQINREHCRKVYEGLIAEKLTVPE